MNILYKLYKKIMWKFNHDNHNYLLAEQAKQMSLQQANKIAQQDTQDILLDIYDQCKQGFRFCRITGYFGSDVAKKIKNNLQKLGYEVSCWDNYSDISCELRITW